MPEYMINPETRMISKNISSKADALLSVLIEGRLASKGKKIFPHLHPVLRAVDEVSGYCFRAHMMKRLAVVPNRIVFATFQGTYTCNCKYIAEEILSRGLDYEIIFLVTPEVYENREAYDFPPEVYLVKKNTAEAFYALATSTFWFDNALNCIWKFIPKKKNQIYINTWHGSLGIKRLSGGKYWRLVAKAGDRQIDYFLTDSTFDEKVFRTSFWPHAGHLKYGHPRNDLFFDKEKMEALRQKVYTFYQIPSDVKLALYAPTFRDNKKDTSAIHVDHENLIHALEERFGGKWMILNRLHFHNAGAASEMQEAAPEGRVIDASTYRDMQELMAAADIGITDYSSWIFDYLFTGRPAFIYATDIENYIHDRGFYYSLDKTPFSIASSDAQLAENIQTFKKSYYNRKIQAFFKRMGCYESGDAAAKTVDFLVQNTKAD